MSTKVQAKYQKSDGFGYGTREAYGLKHSQCVHYLSCRCDEITDSSNFRKGGFVSACSGPGHGPSWRGRKWQEGGRRSQCIQGQEAASINAHPPLSFSSLFIQGRSPRAGATHCYESCSSSVNPIQFLPGTPRGSRSRLVDSINHCYPTPHQLTPEPTTFKP